MKSVMHGLYGAIIGDIVGSKYEFNNIKTKEFPLFSEGCRYTDDTVMTIAVAKALMTARDDRNNLEAQLVKYMQKLGLTYPPGQNCYGARFSDWLRNPDPAPYNSFGNGSAMRVSPCPLIASSLEDAVELAGISAAVTHNHPEGIKGARAVSAAVFMAKAGESKASIKNFIEENYYPLSVTLDQIRPDYDFDVSCQGSVPQAVIAFLESENFEDAIRNAISIGGDSDTIGAITGSIAWSYYYDSSDNTFSRFIDRANEYLPEEFIRIIDEFDSLPHI